MKKDILYTDGVIAVREKYLLGDKIVRMCEGTVEDAYRILQECSFGGSAEAAGDANGNCENLIEAEEAAIDAFIREYAPNETVLYFLLAPRDFFNAKALVKAKSLNCSYEKMVGPEGTLSVASLYDAVFKGNYPPTMPEALRKTIAEAVDLCEQGAGGVEIGDLFEKALYAYLTKLLRFDRTLKKLLAEKIDMTNMLCVLRCGDLEEAQKHFIAGGTLKAEKLGALLDVEDVKKFSAFKGTPYETFVAIALTAYSKHQPQTDAEKILASLELTEYHSRRYGLKGKEPFLYYVLRKRAELINMRIVIVCLAAGMDAGSIKRRLRLGGGTL